MTAMPDPAPDAAPDAADRPARIALSLVSHTNVGKTTLARTLLGRDIGEVRDAAHVTESAEPHTLVDTPAGDVLELWDTPGFGDSQRLAQRLARAGQPLGWLLTEVWDRWRDRPFWASQRAVRHVLQRADVALYLVNAAEAPADAAYLGAELRVLALLDKPVIVLLNQLGPPGTPADEAAQLQRWQASLQALAAGLPATTPPLRLAAVLPLDAFARCWVQEAVLLQAVSRALPLARQPSMARLQAAWTTARQGVWQASMAVLAQRLARAAIDQAELAPSGMAGLAASWRRVGRWLGAASGSDAPADQGAAMQALAARLDADIRDGTARLIELHSLQGQATGEVLARLAAHFSRREPLSEGRAAWLGGLLAGAASGLTADLASGGLTLGGGLLAGGVLGALGAAGAAHGVNRLRGAGPPRLTWQDSVLTELARSALLGYLAVAHHGRGRGDWQAEAAPATWSDAVDAVLAEQGADLAALWSQRETWVAAAAAAAAEQALQAWLQQASAAVLRRLYPEAAALSLPPR